MIAKIALGNIRRSLKDYTVYFVTLLFGVAVFYAFNSITSQSLLAEIDAKGSLNIISITDTMMGIFSLAVAFVLGFLIVYANRFLIRRRKKEFGIYITLGMSPGKVTAIVLLETSLVGLVSLVLGLLLGIALSQGLSFVTALMFNMTMSDYIFVFSWDALIATLINFLVIYLVVALFNGITVNAYNLVDLLHGEEKSERVSVHNVGLSLLGFAASIVILFFAYQDLAENGLQYIDSQFIRATVLMLIGSFLFFWSLSGFALTLLRRCKRIYYQGLSLFTLRQLSSKINTTFISLWVVCVMLFFSLTTFSIGMGLVEFFTADIDEAAPYDASLVAMIDTTLYGSNTKVGATEWEKFYEDRSRHIEQIVPEDYQAGEAFDWSMLAYYSSLGEKWDDLVRSAAQVDIYEAPMSYQVLTDQVPDALKPDFEVDTSNLYISLLSLSQLNDLAALTGKPEMNLNADQYLILNNFEAVRELAESLITADAALDISGTTLHPTGIVDDVKIATSSMQDDSMLIVVPDQIITNLRDMGALPTTSYLNIMYAVPNEEGDVMLRDLVLSALNANSDFDGGNVSTIYNAAPEDLGNDVVAEGDNITYRSFGRWPLTSTRSSFAMRSQSNGLRMLITYLAIYIGLVLLIATATLLAIQQLSETTDSLKRYRLLSHLGCERRKLNRSLLIQTLVYFLAPLSLAICHTACAISTISNSLFSLLAIDPSMAMGAAALFTLVIYGGYLLVTYFTSRNIVKGSLKAA